MSAPTRLSEALQAVAANIPEPIDARIRAGNAAAVASGAVGLPVGAQAPGFRLPNARGEIVELSSLLAQGPVVVSFYRGEWCPFCNLELRALQQNLGAFTARGATLAAISPQSADNSLSVSEKNGLGFEVLSDLDQSVIAAYRLQYTVEGDVRDLMENVFTRDLAAENADGTWRLGVPATFVIDHHGIIAAAHCEADYRTRMEPEAILAALDALH